MLATIIIISLAFTWLGFETRWFTIKLLTGKFNPVITDNWTPYYQELLESFVSEIISFTKKECPPTIMTFESLTLPEFKGTHIVGCKLDQANNTIHLLRKHFIDRLSNALSENIQIGDIVIGKRNLIEALKLQTDDVVSVQYGKSTWSNKNVQGKPSVQISCGRTVMHFFNHSVVKRNKPCEPIPLNFGGCHDAIKSGISLDIKRFQNALANVLCFAEREYCRPNIHGVLFESKDDKLKLVAADGFVLNQITIDTPRIGNHKVFVYSEDCSKIISLLKTLKPNGKGKSKAYPELYMTIDDKTILFKSDTNELTVPIADTKYVDYESLISLTGSKVEFIASQLLQAVKSVCITARDESGAVRLEFTDNKITVLAKSEEIEESKVDCDAIVESTGRIAFNSKYIIAYLSQLKDARVTGLYTSRHDAMTFQADNNQFTCMPMEISEWSIQKEDTEDTIEPVDEIELKESGELLEV